MKRSKLSVVIISAIALLLSLDVVTSARADELYVFITEWGTRGDGDGQFDYAQGIAVDSSGYVYVTDSNSNRIQKFDSSGTFVTKWGSSGSGDGLFYNPYGIAVDSSGYIYVADFNGFRIQKFDSSGTFVTKWGSQGTGDGQFTNPSGVAVDSSGNVYVTDYYANRIQKFTSSGAFVTKWGSEGSGDGQFSTPIDIAVDSSGYVYVTDCYGHRIQKFTSSGTFITKWGTHGSGDGQFDYPRGITVDSSGNVFVADSFNSRIQKFNSSGNFITKWGYYGSWDGEFNNPVGVAIDSSGNVFVADAGNHRIQKFSYDADGLSTLTATMTGAGSGSLSTTGLSCVDNICTGSYPYNTAVTIVASPAVGSTFDGWTGCDYSYDTTCNIVMTGDKAITASFGLITANGACGTSNGRVLRSAPTEDLCSTGTPSAVIGTGPWTWTCFGVNEGTDASCSANFAGTACPGCAVTIKDSYAEKVLAFREEGESWYEEFPAGKFIVTFKLDLNSIFPTTSTENITKQFNSNTCFDISAGAISESFCLGEGGDVKYIEGKPKVTVARRGLEGGGGKPKGSITRQDSLAAYGEKWITYLKIAVKWTAKNMLTIKMSGRPDFTGWILADAYDGMNEPAIADATQATLTVTGDFTNGNGTAIGAFYALSDAPVTGSAATKTLIKGRGENQEEFELTTVNLSGSGGVMIGQDGP
jgi:DNA-binding beta-propeller fold protein YncE